MQLHCALHFQVEGFNACLDTIELTGDEEPAVKPSEEDDMRNRKSIKIPTHTTANTKMRNLPAGVVEVRASRWNIHCRLSAISKFGFDTAENEPSKVSRKGVVHNRSDRGHQPCKVFPGRAGFDQLGHHFLQYRCATAVLSAATLSATSAPAKIS